MKYLYTNKGIFSEEQYLELKEDGVLIESYGAANSGVDEAGASTRRAIDDEEIEASMSDFGGISDEVAELVPPDARGEWLDSGERNPHWNGEEEDPTAHSEFDDVGVYDQMDLDPDEVEGNSDWRLEDDDQIGISLDSEDDGGYVFSDEEWSEPSRREPEGVAEELQHSQTGFADIQPSTIKEFRAAGQKKSGSKSTPSADAVANTDEDPVDKYMGFKKKAPKKKPEAEEENVDEAFEPVFGAKKDAVKRPQQPQPGSLFGKVDPTKKKLQPTMAGMGETGAPPAPQAEADDWRFLYRRLRAGSKAISQDWPKLLDTLEKQGTDHRKGMKMVRAAEDILDNLSQDLQMSKDPAKVRKRAAVGISKNPLARMYIPEELGGDFLD
ncbi:MAG: hypothetical protein WC761_01415 [Candidatus Paceibacterota bacterium]|jgi:hypothetical protein